MSTRYFKVPIMAYVERMIPVKVNTDILPPDAQWWDVEDLAREGANNSPLIPEDGLEWEVTDGDVEEIDEDEYLASQEVPM